MMGRQDRDQGQLFYDFNLDDVIPKGHLLRRMNVFVTADRTDPTTLRSHSQAACRRYGLWHREVPGLCRVFGHHPAHPGMGQEQAGRWHVLSVRVQVRQQAQCLHLSGWQDVDDEWQGSQRSRDPLLRIRPLLPPMPAEAKVLPKHARAPDRAGCQRAGSRHGSSQEKTKAFLISRDQRKRVEMRFAHLKTHHGFERMRLRGLSGARDEFHLAAIVQNLKTMAIRLLKPPPDLAPA
jgi:hypothetical protein